MKVSSFIPAVTQMLYDMNLQTHLDGITFECPKVALQEKCVLVRCILEDKSYSSSEINTLFSNSKSSGDSLYYINEDSLEAISPDIIFTQDLCDVCQIDTNSVEASIRKLSKSPKIISISPNSLEDVFENALEIAEAVGQKSVGVDYVKRLKARISKIIDKQKENRIQPLKVMLLEWVDPLFNCGHWIPYQIKFAGGVDLLSNPSGDSVAIPWSKIVKYDPEILVISPCGYNISRTMEDIKFLEKKREWNLLRSVKNKQVYIADFDMFTQSSASTLVDGIEVLANIFHPDVYKLPNKLKSKFQNYFQ